MLYLLKDKDQNILSYSESDFIPNDRMGESLEIVDLSAREFARRLELSHNGERCATVFAYQGEPDIVIDIATSLPIQSVDLSINGLIDTIPLIERKGKLLLSTANPGTFIISPADRKTFCAAGASCLSIEVLPNA